MHPALDDSILYRPSLDTSELEVEIAVGKLPRHQIAQSVAYLTQIEPPGLQELTLGDCQRIYGSIDIGLWSHGPRLRRSTMESP